MKMLKHFQQVHPAWYSLTGALTGLLKHAGSKSCIKLMFVIVVWFAPVYDTHAAELESLKDPSRWSPSNQATIRQHCIMFHSCGLCFGFLPLFAVLCARNRKDEKPDSIWDDEETLDFF